MKGRFVKRPNNKKRTTIYDLAEIAGTSASAVSSVLNNTWEKRRISSKLAKKITKLAEEHGYARNMQASILRQNKSKIIGMIVPKYDNRYFGSIVETFENMARERGLFPIVTCTRRDSQLEEEAARTMLSYQVSCIISTGATDPDRISDICSAVGVHSLNLDLPGTKAPSVISDNYFGAKKLTRLVLEKNQRKFGSKTPLLFIGGRANDHNTGERVRGFKDAHAEFNITLDEAFIQMCGYAPEKAETALRNLQQKHQKIPLAMFVNSTISLEGVMRWIKSSAYYGTEQPVIGCFDWDPFVALLSNDIHMVRQDVAGMLNAVFQIIDNGNYEVTTTQIQPLFNEF